jgi:hypothetical protein
MRPLIRNIAIFLLGGLIISSLMFLALDLTRNNQNTQAFALDKASMGMSLLLPPTQAIQSAITPPLNTSKMSFIAYYQQVGGWTLANTVPAFINWSNGGNYYDGLVRVWDSGTIGAVSSVVDDAYLDIHVRVRADGWIVAWFDRLLDDPAGIMYWGHVAAGGGAPAPYSTTLSRALEIVYTVAGVGFPGYNQIGMYDYSEPSATRLLVFGNSISYNNPTVNYYYSIPTNSTMNPIKLLIRSGGNGVGKLSVDSGLVFQSPNGWWGWSTYQIYAYAKGIQHSVTQTATYYCNVAFVMWSN